VDAATSIHQACYSSRGCQGKQARCRCNSSTSSRTDTFPCCRTSGSRCTGSSSSRSSSRAVPSTFCARCYSKPRAGSKLCSV